MSNFLNWFAASLLIVLATLGMGSLIFMFTSPSYFISKSHWECTEKVYDICTTYTRKEQKL